MRTSPLDGLAIEVRGWADLAILGSAGGVLHIKLIDPVGPGVSHIFPNRCSGRRVRWIGEHTLSDYDQFRKSTHFPIDG